jgi:hypothetical protein
MPPRDRLEPNRVAIEQRACPHCAGAMVLVLVRPAGDGFELRSFEGLDCSHIDRIMVATYPMTQSLGSSRAQV